MTAPAPWPLLAALDELLARDRWQDDLDAVMAMEFRVADETGIGRLNDNYLDAMSVPLTIDDQVRENEWKNAPGYKWPHPRGLAVGAPFLRSRDAAAMLEKAIPDYSFEMFAAYDQPGRVWLTVRSPEGILLPLRRAHDEAAWRTRAALEAGWRIGLWPVSDP